MSAPTPTVLEPALVRLGKWLGSGVFGLGICSQQKRLFVRDIQGRASILGLPEWEASESSPKH